MFFLEAIERVHKNRAQEYERMGAFVDKKVEEIEPGMLIHVQTRVSETEDEVVYRWVEVYGQYEDLQLHLENEYVQAHIQKLNDGILAAPLEVIVYCDWTEEQKEPWLQTPGISLTFAPLVNGYFR